MFTNRTEAGKLLAKKLLSFKGKNTVILAIPRGGVMVAAEVARVLNSPLSACVVKKIGAPSNPEFAIGAIGPDETIILDDETIEQTEELRNYLQQEVNRLKVEVEERIKKFKSNLPAGGKTVILVDDGIATGATTMAAIKWLKSQHPAKVILAVPVAAPDIIEKLKPEVDKLICLEIPLFFSAVAQFYQDFPQVTDEEVLETLKILKKTN